MMYEIERKFLIPNEDVAREIISQSESPLRYLNIVQGYLSKDISGFDYLRIRNIKSGDEEISFQTIKKNTDNNLVREEYESEIENNYAKELLEKCENFVIKDRVKLSYKEQVLELDFFKGVNEGLIIMEIEMISVDSKIYLPFTSIPLVDVTNIKTFSNENLAESTSYSKILKDRSSNGYRSK